MSPSPHEDPALFDLPLAPTPPESSDPLGVPPPRRARRPASETPESLPLFDEEEFPGADEPPTPTVSAARRYAPEPPESPVPAAPPPAALAREIAARRSRPVPLPPPEPDPPAAGLAARVRGAVGDLAVLAAVGTLALGGLRLLDVPFGAAQAPGLLLFLLAWSFLYFVIALAFWGQTPGMAWAGVIARSGADEPLSFGQTVRRWAGSWLTWALAGLPGLLALTGRSLSDRLSDSRTYELPVGPPRPGSTRIARGRPALGAPGYRSGSARPPLAPLAPDTERDPGVGEEGDGGEDGEPGNIGDERRDAAHLVDDSGGALGREGEAAQREERMTQQEQPEAGQEPGLVEGEQDGGERHGHEREISLHRHRPGAEARAAEAAPVAPEEDRLDRASGHDHARPEPEHRGRSAGARRALGREGGRGEQERPERPGPGRRQVGTARGREQPPRLVEVGGRGHLAGAERRLVLRAHPGD